MEFEEEVVTKGVPFRMRLGLVALAAVVLSAVAAPIAFAQSPDDIPGFDQLPIPGGEDPAAEPSEAPGGGGGGGGDNTPQVDAPGGGVDTGAGGLAGQDTALVLAAAGAVAAMGGAVYTARRRAVRG